MSVDPYVAARTALASSLRNDVSDERVIEAIGRVPRHRFVPDDLKALAYYDRPLPIGHGQTISQPRMVAIMLQEMDLDGDEKVLEVGAGSGYQAAVLGELAGHVVSVERIPLLAESAARILDELEYQNVEIHVEADILGHPEDAPYDAIIVAAAAPRVPQALVAQLAPGGRIVIPVGDHKGQDLIVVESRREGLAVTRKGACRFVPLIGGDAFRDGDFDDPDLSRA